MYFQRSGLAGKAKTTLNVPQNILQYDLQYGVELQYYVDLK